MVFMDEDSFGENEIVLISVSDILERFIAFQMLMTGGSNDKEVLKLGCLLQSLDCFHNLFTVLFISLSIGNGVHVRKYLGINN